MSAREIVLVDDDATLRKVLERELRGFGYEVAAFGDGRGVVERVRAQPPDVALLDLKLPDIDGLELLRRIREAEPDLPCVMLTGHGAVPEAVEAMRRGAYDFLTKPASLDVLENVLARACERRDLRAENARLRRLVDGSAATSEITGDDPRTEELRSLVQRVSRSEASVLILGENGTGKELVARALHEGSPRAERPFVVVNCGAIPDSLIESELFGHEKGSFTGAERKRVGLFEAAHRGTLFLDEIGELPLAVQPVLLRALQAKEIRAVGDDRPRRVDVRVLAATNRDLLAEVEAGRFREDLYYRLSTIVIDVPPLRARGRDIVQLARAFLAREAAQQGVELELEPAALEALATHPWPGNVRELQNAIARLATLASAPRITLADVERYVTARRRLPSGDALPTLEIEALERLAIEAAMKKHAGNKRAAAAELGVALKTLYNKLERYAGEGR
jgi:DNA-binding NtrC family response regulator